jgi:ADP-ribosylglycohydrolase
MSSDFSPVAPDGLFSISEPSDQEPLFSMIIGSLVAAASADALGWVTEFMRSPRGIQKYDPDGRIRDYVGWRKIVGGRFNAYIDFIGPGEYSDDTQLTLAVARSLGAHGNTDNEYFAHGEFPAWLAYSRGAGRTITAAAKTAARSGSRWNQNFFETGKLDYRRSGANGAAMRVSPIALAHLQADAPPFEAVFANAIVSHGHPRAHVGALLVAAAIHEAARRRLDRDDIGGFQDVVRQRVQSWRPSAADSPEIHEWLELWGSDAYLNLYDQTLREMEDLLEPRAGGTDELFRELGSYDRATKSSGTVTVAAAIHLVSRFGRDLEEAVLQAVNAVPSDTDTIAAFIGAIGGTYAGYESIPERWTARLQDHGYFIAVGEEIARFAAGATQAVCLRPRLLPGDEELPDVMTLLHSDQLAVGLRVRHPILGAGWISAVHAQEIRRRGGGQMIYARTAFDLGQHCQLRAYLQASAKS